MFRALLPLPLILLAACQGPCRSLCAEWFDYQEDVCGVLDLNDERISCLADYSARLVTEAETAECAQRRTELADVVAGATGDDAQACCPGRTGAGCPWQSEP